jgi:biopolymer transport protein ExbB/TolQ
MNFAAFEKVRYGMMGAGIGLGLVSLVTVIFPPAAAIGGVLAVGAALFGGKKMWEQLEEQKQAEAINKLQQKLTETMMLASVRAQQHFAEASQQLKQFARDTFTEAAKRARKDLQTRVQDVQAARTRNGQETQSKIKDLQSRLQGLTAMAEMLAPLLPKRPATSK